MTRTFLSLLAITLIASGAVADDARFERLARDLGSTDYEVSSAASRAIKEEGSRAIPAVLEAMEKSPRKSAYISTLFTERLAPFAEAGVPRFVKMLEGGPHTMSLMLLLKRVGPGALGARPGLRRILADPERSDTLRAVAAECLLRGGSPVREIQRSYAPKQALLFGALQSMLHALGDAAPYDKDAVAAILEVAAPVRGDELRPAMEAICRLGSQAASLAPVLRGLLEEGDPAERLLAAAGLICVGKHRKEALSHLEKVSLADDHRTAMRLGDALRLAITPETIEVVAPLLSNPGPVRAAFKLKYALARLGDKIGPAAPAVRAWLSEQRGVDAGLMVMAHMGRAAAPDRQALEHFVEHGNAQDRVTACAALLRLDPGDSELHTTLAASLEDLDRDARFEAARALGAASSDAPKVAPHLVRLARDEDDEVRYRATIGLAGLGERGQSHVPFLLKLLEDRHPLVRAHAAFALSRVLPQGPTTKGEAALLSKHLSNAHWVVRAWVAVLLLRSPYRRKVGASEQAVLQYAAAFRPELHRATSTDYTWEPNIERELRLAAQAARGR